MRSLKPNQPQYSSFYNVLPLIALILVITTAIVIMGMLIDIPIYNQV